MWGDLWRNFKRIKTEAFLYGYQWKLSVDKWIRMAMEVGNIYLSFVSSMINIFTITLNLKFSHDWVFIVWHILKKLLKNCDTSKVLLRISISFTVFPATILRIYICIVSLVSSTILFHIWYQNADLTWNATK